jgi:virulence-associated protein VagC
MKIICMSKIVIRKVWKTEASPTVISVPPQFGLRENQYVLLRKDDSKIIIEPLKIREGVEYE